MNQAIVLIETAKAKAEESVDYTPKDGAVCPECGRKHLRVITSRPWEDDTKVRYHKCDNEDCILGRIGLTIKSIQAN